MAMSPSAGFVYRCPLCSQRFAGRPGMSIAERVDAAPRPLTVEIAASDPHVLEHLASHSALSWLVKIAALEQTADDLRDRLWALRGASKDA